MNAHTEPLDDLELCSVLDGEASPEVLARLQNDPAGQSRLDQLRAAREAVGSSSVEPMEAATLDDMIGRALAELGKPSPAGTDSEGPGSDVVAPLSRTAKRSVPSWLVAAVVVVLVGIGLGLVRSGTRSDSEAKFETAGAAISSRSDPSELDESAGTDSALAVEESASDAAADDAAASSPLPEAEAGEGSAGLSTTTAPSTAPSAEAQLVQLGDFEDTDDLREHLRGGFPTEPIVDTDRGDGVTDLAAASLCLNKVKGLLDLSGEPIAAGLATVADQPMVVYELAYVTDDGRDTTVVMAVGELTCIPELTFQR